MDIMAYVSQQKPCGKVWMIQSETDSVRGSEGHSHRGNRADPTNAVSDKGRASEPGWPKQALEEHRCSQGCANPRSVLRQLQEAVPQIQAQYVS